MKTLSVPTPDVIIIPTDYWRQTVAPWADKQTDLTSLRQASAKLSGLETAYRNLDLETISLQKARRVVEIRIGELLPKEQGKRTDKLQPRGGEVYTQQDRSRFRKLAQHKKTLFEYLDSIDGEDSAGKLTRAALLRLVNSRQSSNGQCKPLISIKGHFALLYADPPWKYEHAVSESRAIENQYPTMTLDQICELKPPCAKDSTLFLWATSPKLAEAIQVINSWGFDYRTCAVWDKGVIGMGYYFRQQHELLLVAVLGKPPAPIVSSRVSSVLRYKRTKHSSKPVECYSLLESMYPQYDDKNRIELFARSKRNGWSAWGNEL